MDHCFKVVLGGDGCHLGQLPEVQKKLVFTIGLIWSSNLKSLLLYYYIIT